jgi:hypothetical protein
MSLEPDSPGTIAGHRREARLRPEFAAQYPGMPAGAWKPVQEVLDMVSASRLLSGRRSGELLGTRPLDDRHFEFRGGYMRTPLRRTPSGDRQP